MLIAPSSLYLPTITWLPVLCSPAVARPDTACLPCLSPLPGVYCGHFTLQAMNGSMLSYSPENEFKTLLAIRKKVEDSVCTLDSIVAHNQWKWLNISTRSVRHEDVTISVSFIINLCLQYTLASPWIHNTGILCADGTWGTWRHDDLTEIKTLTLSSGLIFWHWELLRPGQSIMYNVQFSSGCTLHITTLYAQMTSGVF